MAGGSPTASRRISGCRCRVSLLVGVGRGNPSKPCRCAGTAMPTRTAVGAGGGEGGGAEHGVDGALVAVQAHVGEERGGVTGAGLGDRFDDEAGQGPLQRRAVDPGVDHLHQGGRRRDHPEIVSAGQGEPAHDTEGGDPALLVGPARRRAAPHGGRAVGTGLGVLLARRGPQSAGHPDGSVTAPSSSVLRVWRCLASGVLRSCAIQATRSQRDISSECSRFVGADSDRSRESLREPDEAPRVLSSRLSHP